MADISKVIQDGAGSLFEVLFRENEDGSVSPLHVTLNGATEATLEALRQAVEAQAKGATLAESTQDQHDAAGGVHTFAADVAAIEIVNADAENSLVATVNGIAIIVPPETAWGPSRVGGSPSPLVTVTGAAAYLLNRYE